MSPREVVATAVLSKAGRSLAGLVILLVAVLNAACAEGPAFPFPPTPSAVAEPTAEVEPTPEPPPVKADLRPQAEGQFLVYMNQGVATAVREQAWFADLTPPTMELIAAVQRCEKAAQSKGQVPSVAEMLRFASEQAWYVDGLDEREAAGLSAVFDAYATSLRKEDFAVGRYLSSTLRWGLFEPMTLPESGKIVVLASAPDESRGRLLLETAVEHMQPVEELVGKFPYSFLHLTVSDDMPDEILGASIDEFILIHGDYVEPYVITHEIAHSTLYGTFPEWFEEGMAHFIEYYLTSELDFGYLELAAELGASEMDERIDLRAGKNTWQDSAVERYRGYIFLYLIHDALGHESFTTLVRQLRTRNYGDQDLLRAIATYPAPAAQQAQVRQVICEIFIGVRNLSCV